MLNALTLNARYVLAGIIGLLILATLGLVLYDRLHADRDQKELYLRMRSWWIMVAVFSLSLALGRAGSLLFLGLLSFFALREYFTLVPHRPQDWTVVMLTFLAIPLQYLCIGLEKIDLSISFIPLYILFVVTAADVLAGTPSGFLVSIGTVAWGAIIIVFGLSHLGLLVILPASVNPGGGALGLLIFLVCLTEISDVVQFLAGKSLGRHRIIASVSPNKTWEGLIGGLAVISVLAAFFAPWLTPMNYREGMIAGILIGLAGFMGDITVSTLKRDLGVKDCGTLIPGHGGMLDRIDSLILSAPVFFHFLYWSHYT